MVKLQVEESRAIAPGTHKGRIATLIERETESYGTYLDLLVDVFDANDEIITTLSVGYPAKINASTRLGKLLKRFGVELVTGTEIDPEEILTGKTVQFVTEDEKNENGTWARIDPDTVAPLA